LRAAKVARCLSRQEILYTKNTSVQVTTGAMLNALKHAVTPDDLCAPGCVRN
jgi:hypothetical protein